MYERLEDFRKRQDEYYKEYKLGKYNHYELKGKEKDNDPKNTKNVNLSKPSATKDFLP